MSIDFESPVERELFDAADAAYSEYMASRADADADAAYAAWKEGREEGEDDDIDAWIDDMLATSEDDYW